MSDDGRLASDLTAARARIAELEAAARESAGKLADERVVIEALEADSRGWADKYAALTAERDALARQLETTTYHARKLVGIAMHWNRHSAHCDCGACNAVDDARHFVVESAPAAPPGSAEPHATTIRQVRDLIVARKERNLINAVRDRRYDTAVAEDWMIIQKLDDMLTTVVTSRPSHNMSDHVAYVAFCSHADCKAEMQRRSAPPSTSGPPAQDSRPPEGDVFDTTPRAQTKTERSPVAGTGVEGPGISIAPSAPSTGGAPVCRCEWNTPTRVAHEITGKPRVCLRCGNLATTTEPRP